MRHYNKLKEMHRAIEEKEAKERLVYQEEEPWIK